MNTEMLFYTKPAEHYMEALPLGNGAIGAMCYSGVRCDEISLNHDTLWTGHPRTVTRDGAYESYRKAQALAIQGEYRECQKEIEKNFLTCWSQAYLTFGSLKLHFGYEDVSDYERRLDLSRAVLTSAFTADGHRVKKSAFISYPDSVFVYRIEGNHLSFKAEIECPLKHSSFAQGDTFIIDGECPGDGDTHSKNYPCNALIYSDKEEERGVLFRGAFRVETDGEAVYTDTAAEVRDASYAVIYLNISTGYNGFDKSPATEGQEYQNKCLSLLDKAVSLGYDALLERHLADYKALYDRVSFTLDGASSEELTTDERLKRFEKDPSDSELYTLLFHFGRYLLIASSRPGTTATNLQGIWNNSVKAPWNSNYTVNINTQMNYWPVLPCAMPELMEPLVDLMKMLAQTGEVTAREFYRAKGFVVHHNTDIWGHSVPVHGGASWAYWQGGSGWLCQNLFDIYAYTLDQDFLEKTAFPIMKKAAEFYLDILEEDTDGTLMITPATSPENTFSVGLRNASVAKSTAMMNSIVLDLFTNCKKACEVLGIDDEFYRAICAAGAKIKPLQIGENGAVLEWNEPLKETEVHHRHVSHLYALHPAGLITKDDTALFDACRKTLEIRGDNGTGWSLAWKTNFWARLLDGNHALTLVENQLKHIPAKANEKTNYVNRGGTFPNMLDAHPPFQIDGNFGIVSGMCEMLLQSDGETVYLLPALPDKWHSGSVKGLAARGGARVDIEWKNGTITDYHIHSDNDKLKIVLCR